MHIELTNQEKQRLAHIAAAAGFGATQDFLTQHIRALAAHATDEAPLSTPELAQSLAMCDHGMQDIAEGKYATPAEALEQTLNHIRLNS